MNYTIKKQSIIFELPLSSYFGTSWRRHYNKESQEWTTEREAIESIQDYEEDLYMNFESFGPYITLEDAGEYYNLKEAEEYLIKKGYTQEEINAFRDTLNADLHRALTDAKDSSYQYEYSQKLYSMVQEQIEEDLKALNVNYKLFDDITTKDFQANQTDQDHVKIEILKKDIKEWLKENYPEEKYHLEADYIDFFHDYCLDNIDAREVNQEYIDQYGTLGNSDGWLDCFKDYNEIETEIDNYRKDEADKIDNAERASLELKQDLENINRYAAKYFTKEPTRQKIARQVTALKSVIKNAV